MEVNATEVSAPAWDAEAIVPDVAQPASQELADIAPSGSSGALAKNWSAWRREG